MIDNMQCSVHPSRRTRAAVTTEEGHTIGMCIECYSIWCEAKRERMKAEAEALQQEPIQLPLGGKPGVRGT